MMDGPIESNSGTTAVATPPEGQATPTTPETPSQSGQADSQVQSAPAEEQFTVVTDASNIVASCATKQGTDVKLLRHDFYALDEDQLITGFLSINPPDDRSQQAYVKRLNDAYGWAKATTQKYYEKGKAE